MRFGLALLIFWGALADGMAAGANVSPSAPAKSPVVLELFTSEGCSSCPPADRLLVALDAKQPFPNADLVVLSEHVDYWDGSKWRDPYSSKLFTERQQSYAARFGLDSIYTPQLVVDGKREVVGGNWKAVEAAILQISRVPKVAVTISAPVRERGGISLHLSSAEFPPGTSSSTIYVAVAEDSVQSRVTGGENRGRELSHVAVVRILQRVGAVTAGTVISQKVFLAATPQRFHNGLRLIAFVQENHSMHILGSAQIRM